jgi:hypothetical protein
MPFDDTSVRTNFVAKTLLGGRKWIEWGWVQHHAFTPNGVCLAGSLYDAPNNEVRVAAFMILQQAIKETGFATGSLSVYNDTPGRTKDEILAVYDRAIELSLPA